MDILWFSSCFFFSLPEKCFAKNIQFPFPGTPSLRILTAAWITKVAMWVMNQLKSHHMERRGVTLSRPPDPDPGPRASPNELSIYYSEIRMRCVAGSEEVRCMQTCFLQILKPNKSAILFQAHLHTLLTYSARVHDVKAQISQRHRVCCSWNCLGLEFKSVVQISSGFLWFLWSKTCYYLMAGALIRLMFNAPSLAEMIRVVWKIKQR